jgi:hypothetical protein
MLSYHVLRPETTPERLYSLCKIIAEANYSKDKLKEIIQPTLLKNNDDGYVSKNIKFAKDLGLIIEENKKIKLNIPKEIVDDNKKFKEFLYQKLIKDEAFFEVTKWFLAQDQSLWELGSIDIPAQIKTFSNLNKEYFWAYRFWFAYFGWGMLFDGKFINNPYRRLKEFIVQKSYPTGKNIQMKEFFNDLISKYPEFEVCIIDYKINLSLTLALVTLNEINFLRLNYLEDSPSIYHLYFDIPVKGISQKSVTHLIIYGGCKDE